MEKQKLLTTEEVSRLVNIRVDTLCKWRQRGKGIPFVRLGGSVRYRPEDIDEYLKQNTVKGK